MTLDVVLVIVLVCQFLAAFLYSCHLNGGFYLQDIRVLFLLSFGLYSLFWPVVSTILGLSPADRPFRLTILSYNLAIFAFNLVLFTKRKRWPRNARMARLKTRTRNFIPQLLFLIILVLYSFYYMYSKGIPVFAFGGFDMNRLEYTSYVNQVWVILKFIIAGVVAYLIFYYRLLKRWMRLVLIATVLFYILYQVSLGNRNEFVLIVFFVLGFVLVRRKKPISLRTFVLLFFFFAFSFFITVMRDVTTRRNSGAENLQLVMRSNEFMFPMQTTYYVIKDQWPLRLGETYVIMPIRLIIPRALQSNKPQDLGSEFTAKTFGDGMSGWAYTPVTEAYLNFGIVGPFLIYLLIALYLNHLVEEVRRKGVSRKYLIVFSIIFNFCRGDFSGTVYMVFVIWLTILLMRSRLYLKKRPQVDKRLGAAGKCCLPQPQG